MDDLRCPIAQMADENPHMPAITAADQTYSYAQLNYAVSHLASHLKKEGMTASSRVAFIASPSLPSILLFFALFRIKAIACPLSTHTPSAQIPFLLHELNAHHYLMLDQLPINTSYAPPFEEYLDLNQMATMVFTSGSSDTPKIACHTLGNHYYSALGSIPALKLTSHSRCLLSLPLFHVGGISTLFRCSIAASTLVLSQAPLNNDTLLNHKITHISLVPTQLYRLLQESSCALQELTCVLLGGAPLPLSLYNRALSAGLPLYYTYGMTEMSSMITLASPTEMRKELHIGPVLPFRQIALACDKEIYVRGKTLFAGYWNPIRKKPDLILKKGWFPTKDLGQITSDNHWIWLGRKDRLFISGGENIQPEEIEHALCSLPGIYAAYVEAAPDLEFGQRPIAYILEEKPQHTLDSIKAALKEKLPSFKHPVHIFPFTQQMREQMKPKSPSKNQE